MNRRGFTLLEVMATVFLVVAFMVAAVWVSGSVFRLMYSVPEGDNRALAARQAIEMLRDDVWGASELRVSPDAVVLTDSATGTRREWRLGPDGTLTRNTDTTTSWRNVAPSASFSPVLSREVVTGLMLTSKQGEFFAWSEYLRLRDLAPATREGR